jgi:hypothetical protein
MLHYFREMGLDIGVHIVRDHPEAKIQLGHGGLVDVSPIAIGEPGRAPEDVEEILTPPREILHVGLVHMEDDVVAI